MAGRFRVPMTKMRLEFLNTGDVTFDTPSDVESDELIAFYARHQHGSLRDSQSIGRMLEQTYCWVTARRSGELIGIARGVTDGVRGYLAECKLDQRYQGPACVTRTEGRIEHDQAGIARKMAQRVIEALLDSGVEHIAVLAYGTEVDFCEELGFRRASGMVPLQLEAADARKATTVTAPGAAS